MTEALSVLFTIVLIVLFQGTTIGNSIFWPFIKTFRLGLTKEQISSLEPSTFGEALANPAFSVFANGSTVSEINLFVL